MTESFNDTRSGDDVLRKFREALDRKNHHDSYSMDHKDAQSKIHDTHGPAEHKRGFRRKTG